MQRIKKQRLTYLKTLGSRHGFGSMDIILSYSLSHICPRVYSPQKHVFPVFSVPFIMVTCK